MFGLFITYVCCIQNEKAISLKGVEIKDNLLAFTVIWVDEVNSSHKLHGDQVLLVRYKFGMT
jgi:hypothetical protein